MERLGILGQEIDALKAKRATNSLEAARAEETATMARDKANEAKQVSMTVISDKMCYFNYLSRIDLLAIIVDGEANVQVLMTTKKPINFTEVQ